MHGWVKTWADQMLMYSLAVFFRTDSFTTQRDCPREAQSGSLGCLSLAILRFILNTLAMAVLLTGRRGFHFVSPSLVYKVTQCFSSSTGVYCCHHVVSLYAPLLTYIILCWLLCGLVITSKAMLFSYGKPMSILTVDYSEQKLLLCLVVMLFSQSTKVNLGEVYI